jgi:hypothetical protein
MFTLSVSSWDYDHATSRRTGGLLILYQGGFLFVHSSSHHNSMEAKYNEACMAYMEMHHVLHYTVYLIRI